MSTQMASAQIRIPTALRQFAGGQANYDVTASTVGQALSQLTAEYPDLGKHLSNDEGQLRSFVNINSAADLEAACALLKPLDGLDGAAD